MISKRIREKILAILSFRFEKMDGVCNSDVRGGQQNRTEGRVKNQEIDCNVNLTHCINHNFKYKAHISP